MVKELQQDPEREERIIMEIVVDAYDAQERSIGWYYYLHDQLQFPFTATCIIKRAISPLLLNDVVMVTGMPDEKECMHEMFVTIRRGKDCFAVPLSQLKPAISADKQTAQAVSDWHYWVKMGYDF